MPDLSSTLHVSWGFERQALIQKKPSVATKSSASSSGSVRGPKSPGVAQVSRRHHRTCTLSALPVGRNRTTGAPAVERIAAVRSDDLNAAPGPGVGGDPLALRIGSGHRDHLRM